VTNKEYPYNHSDPHWICKHLDTSDLKQNNGISVLTCAVLTPAPCFSITVRGHPDRKRAEGYKQDERIEEAKINNSLLPGAFCHSALLPSRLTLHYAHLSVM
jgi:hypothetical protein